MSATVLSVLEVKAKHLRCHEDVIWSPKPGINLIIGANGSGKTTLLEAVYLMSHGRSFRQARDPFLVQKDQGSFVVHGRWQRFGPMNLSIAGRRGQTTLRLQGRDVQRRKDVSESFPVLVEAPQGRRLVDGAPGERRRWLDALTMICFQSMAAHYERYLRSVMQRGRLLRRRAGSDELDAWEQQIVHHGMPIVRARETMIAQLNSLLAEECELTEAPLEFAVAMPDYQPEAWLTRLQQKRDEDRRSGGLRFGPHCDRIQIHYRGREIRSAGSRGQQKLAAIAIKMAECGLWSRYRGLVPVLLFDDCLEALDSRRQQQLLQRLKRSDAQILMTAPVGSAVESEHGITIQLLDAAGLHGVMDGADSASDERGLIMEEAA